MKYCFAYIALCIVGFHAYSQNCDYNFSGKIIDFHNGEAIVNATVFNETTGKYTSSDFNGQFKFENLCEGVYKFTITHISCETKQLEITLKDNLEEVIYLEHHIEELETVKVEGRLTKKQTETSQETILNNKTIDKLSSASLGDVIKEVSGVTSINTGNEIVKPVINGLHSSRVLIMNNNVRMEDQEWGIEHAPNIDVNTADNISVIKGSGALAYGGDAIGGVVVLNPKSVIVKDTLFGKTIAGFQSNGRAYNVSSELYKNFDSGWFVNGLLGYKQNGDLKAPDYYLNNTGSKNLSTSLQGGFKSFEKGFEVYFSHLDNEIGILSASHIGNTEDLVNAINSKEPLINEGFSNSIKAPKQDVSHTLFKLDGYKRFKSFGKLTVQYDYQNNHRYEYDKRVGDDRDKPAVDLRLQTHSARADVKIDNLENYKIDFGITGKFQDNFANAETGVRRLIPDYERIDFGAFVIAKTNLTEDILVDLGLRYDFNHIDAYKYYYKSRWEERGYDEDFNDIIIRDNGTQWLTNPVFTFNNFSFATGATYSLNENQEFMLNYSLSSRPPNVSELFSDGLHHSAARIELGDLRIDKEISNRVGLRYKLQQKEFLLNIDTYYNHINNFIYIRPTGTESTIRGSFPVWEYAQTNANIMGIDLTLNYGFLSHFNLNSKASYIYGQNLIDDVPLIDIPSFRFNSALSYFKDDWHNFNVSLDYEFVAEQNRYPNYNFETYVPTTDTFELVDISTPPPAYNLFSINAEMTFDMFHNNTLNVLVGVDNIFNTSYREYLNRLRYFADDTGRNITVQLKFNY